jgi:hypothetical protein
MKKRGPKPGILRPHQWLSGPDQYGHKLFVDCQKARAQAKFRGEDWQISEQDYIDLWMDRDQHLSKGRGRYDLTMTRIDPEKAWTVDNVHIITRIEHLRKSNRRKIYA